MSLYSSQVTCPCFHLLYAFFFEFCQLLLVHPFRFSTVFACFPAFWNEPFLCLEDISVNQPAFVAPSQPSAMEFFPSRSLNRSESPLLKSRVVVPLFALVFFSFSQDAEFHYLMVTAANVALSFYTPDQFFLICKYEIQQKVFLSTTP